MGVINENENHTQEG